MGDLQSRGRAAPAAGAFPRLPSPAEMLIPSLLHFYSAGIGCLSACRVGGAEGSLSPISRQAPPSLTPATFPTPSPCCTPLHGSRPPTAKPVPVQWAHGAAAFSLASGNGWGVPAESSFPAAHPRSPPVMLFDSGFSSQSGFGHQFLPQKLGAPLTCPLLLMAEGERKSSVYFVCKNK